MRIKEVRKAQGKSQIKVAKDLGISQQNMCRYEKQQIEPDIQTLIKLANYFHTTVDYLIGHDVAFHINKATLSNTQIELVEKIKELTDIECTKLYNFAEGIIMNRQEKPKPIISKMQYEEEN